MQHRRFTIFLAMLMSIMILSPLSQMIRVQSLPRLAPILTMLLFSAMLLSAIFAVAWNRRHVILAGTLTLIEIVIHAINLSMQSEWLFQVQYLLGSAILVLALALLLRVLFVEKTVTFEVIAASLCGYLLLGILWSNLYLMLEVSQPGSFAHELSLDSNAAEPAALLMGKDHFAAALYFSFVTLTTLGYGEITPATTPARMLCTVEAIAGQLYLAVIVARLVGLHIASQSGRQSPQSGPGLRRNRH